MKKLKYFWKVTDAYLEDKEEETKEELESQPPTMQQTQEPQLASQMCYLGLGTVALSMNLQGIGNQ
jgi:hypothetical protein